MPRLSKADERWPLIETLSQLGWGIDSITDAIGWSRATVENDLRVRGGYHKLFPNRPHGPRAVYKATFRFWMRNPKMDELLRSVIELYLDIPRLRTTLAGIDRAYWVLRQPVYASKLQPYVDLAHDVLGHPRPNTDDSLWNYLFAVHAGMLNEPESSDEAVDTLMQIATESTDRRNLMVWTPEGLRELIDRWLDKGSVEVFGENTHSNFVLTHLYGLRDQPKLSLEQVGERMGVTREHVCQIKSEALHRLRRPEPKHELERCFMTLGRVQEWIKDSRAIISRQAKKIEELEVLCDELKRLTHSSTIEMLQQMPDPVMLKRLHRRIDWIDFSVRTTNSLRHAGIEYVWQLVKKSEADLLKLWHFGSNSLNEVKEILAEMDLELGMDLRDLLDYDAPR